MKKWILTIASAGILVAVAIHFTGRKPVPPTEPVVEAVTGENEESVQPQSASRSVETPSVSTEAPAATSAPTPAMTDAELKTADTNSDPLTQALAVILSSPSDSQRSQQKPVVWKQLREAGLLGAAIAELKKRAADHPAAAEYPLAIGEAYIEAIQATENYNERGVLAMQADTSFDEALRMDPTNWEAQYMKAASLSHWPEGLGKRPEVIRRLTDLIDQQETLPQQPLFVESYVLLGEQYAKSGNFEYARAVWQLGLGSFPADPTLRKRIADLAREPEH
ncbi:MAG: hypothetical protein KIS67_15985 [Verrucomicrobiae bacterium]|nr:hypothetical protein [Verrucomicrobiae bacterium]